MQGPLAAGGGRRGAARRLPIPLPAPLASGAGPSPPPARVVDLPRLRWAARCHDRQFERGVVPLHAHDETELVFCTRGRTTIVVEGSRLEGRPGDLYVLPPRRAHALTGTRPWENLCVLYAGGDAVIDNAPRVIPIGIRHRLRRWLLDLAVLHDLRPETPGGAADALVLAILSDVAEIERRSDHVRSFHPRLAAAVAYLRARLDEAVTAEALAQATGTSYSHLGALFRARFGCGPLDYHRARRLDRARNLLLDPHLSVAAVAARLGFDDVSYFVRAFRKAHGLPPHRWRRDAGRR